MLGSDLLCKRSDVSFTGRRSSSIKNLSYARGAVVQISVLTALQLVRPPKAHYWHSGQMPKCALPDNSSHLLQRQSSPL